MNSRDEIEGLARRHRFERLLLQSRQGPEPDYVIEWPRSVSRARTVEKIDSAPDGVIGLTCHAAFEIIIR